MLGVGMWGADWCPCCPEGQALRLGSRRVPGGASRPSWLVGVAGGGVNVADGTRPCPLRPSQLSPRPLAVRTVSLKALHQSLGPKVAASPCCRKAEG